MQTAIAPAVAHDALVIHLAPVASDRVAARIMDYLDKEAFARYLAACRSVGAQYDATIKAQVGKLERLGDFVHAMKDAGFAVTLDPKVAETLQSAIAAVKAEASQLNAAAQSVSDAFKARGLSLWGFQSEGVAWLSSRRAGLLGDDPGLGKTIQGGVAIPPKSPVVVICPATLKGNWVKELSIWRPDLYPTVLEGRNSFRWPLPNEVVILNWDILPPEEKGVLLLGRDPRPGTVIIADEAHMAKSNKAGRSKRFRAMCKAVLARDGYAWPMTGTPILNRPPELWTLLDHIGLAKEAFGSWPNFCRLFAQNKASGTWGTPLPEAADRLRRVMLRRRRVEVLPDLPTKQHIDIDVPLDEDATRLCDETWAEVKAAGIDIEEAIAIAQNGSGFESISKVRAAIATAMIPHMLDAVREAEDAGEPLVVACSHRAPIDLLERRPGWKVITGDVDPMKRSAIVSLFQRGALKGIGLTIAAGGVGLTLTHAHRMLFVDVMWTPALNTQCEDRICRIGQTRGCLIHRLKGQHELVDHVYTRLLEKQLIIDGSVEQAAVKEGGAAIGANAAAAALEQTLAHVASIAEAPAHGVRTARVAPPITPLDQIGPEDAAPF